MRRRDFIAGLGGVAAWPVVARAQQAKVPVIGFLHVGSSDSFADELAAFRKGLSETGFVEGRNVVIEYRWAEGRREQLPSMAADLISRRVAVITATPSSAATAATAATTTVPIVFLSSFDPVKLGLVASLSRPGGNATGISNLSGELESKQLQLVRELVPSAGVIAQLVNPNNRNAQNDTKTLQETAQVIGQSLVVVNVSSASEIEPTFADLVRQRVGALIVPADVLFTRQREKLIALAAYHALPAIYTWRSFAKAGGLMTYGTDLAEAYRLTGVYTGRVLKGEKPARLPIIQSTKIELAINLKTAKALGITVPPSLLARADEVIE